MNSQKTEETRGILEEVPYDTPCLDVRINVSRTMSWRHSRKQGDRDDKARAERDSRVMVEVGNDDVSGEGYGRIVMSGTMLQAS